jgi:CheY-like chemotaxis protein
MELIEKHPDPQIHHRFHQEIEKKISRTKRFEPRITIVLVEGDSRMRMMVHDELVKYNFNVKGVSSIDKAEHVIERLLEKQYSPIVVTDVDFPNRKEGIQLEGLSFMETLHQKYPQIPILVSTSYPISNLRRKILFFGGVFCLIKPDLTILSSKNFEQIFGAFIRELSYCLDLSIQQYYQEYYQERSDIIKDDLIEDLYNTKAELIALGRQLVADSNVLETYYNMGDMLVKRGDVDGAIESLLEFMAGHFNHVALFLWRSKYLNGYIGGSNLRADFAEKIQQVSVEHEKIPFLKKLYDDKGVFFGPPPKEKEYLEFLDRFVEERPGSHLLYPVDVMGKTVALWYADMAEAKEDVRKTRVFVSLANLIHLSLKMDIEGG